jgi:hypothetical protein
VLEAGSSGHVEDVDVLQTLSTLWALRSGDWRDLEGVSQSRAPRFYFRNEAFGPSEDARLGGCASGGPNPNANFVSDSGSVQ